MNSSFLFIVLLFFTGPALAQTPSFQMPLDCTLGKTCWVVNHVDVDPSPEAKDFNCGFLTYNDHHGTDFGISDRVTMENGVNVLAAADGKILRIRDGIEDKHATKEEREKMRADNKGCGNGVLIDHRGGWQTIYCHMKKNSLIAQRNQTIKAGDKIGEVGLSGASEFPHLHFGVFFEGNTIDPYTGKGDKQGCGHRGRALWDPVLELKYEPVSIYATGFKAGVPDFDAVKIDGSSPDKISATNAALTFWVSLYGIAKDDRIYIEIRAPSGRIFAKRETVQEESRARQFYFIGRKVHSKGLETGTYTGNVYLIRTMGNGETIERRASHILTVE